MKIKILVSSISILLISSILFGCASPSYSSSGSYSSEPNLPDGPRWPKGNSAFIDNVFPKIISYQIMQDDDTLTSLQKSEYSTSDLLGEDIFITTRVSNVYSDSITGMDLKNDSWKPNEYIGRYVALYPIVYDFKFNANSPVISSLSQYSKGQIVNIKGKLKRVSKMVSEVTNGGSIALEIYIEDCEFFQPNYY